MIKSLFIENGINCFLKNHTLNTYIYDPIISEGVKILIMNYDRECFGYERPEFMIPWLTQKQAKAFKYFQNDKLQGFAVLRKTRKGWKIGPLFADNLKVAEELYKTCLNSAKEEEVYLDIPVVNKNAVDLISKYNATYVFECARMYYGKPPDIDIRKVFGITSFELG